MVWVSSFCDFTLLVGLLLLVCLDFSLVFNCVLFICGFIGVCGVMLVC